MSQHSAARAWGSSVSCPSRLAIDHHRNPSPICGVLFELGKCSCVMARFPRIFFFCLFTIMSGFPGSRRILEQISFPRHRNFQTCGATDDSRHPKQGACSFPDETVEEKSMPTAAQRGNSSERAGGRGYRRVEGCGPKWQSLLRGLCYPHSHPCAGTVDAKPHNRMETPTCP